MVACFRYGDHHNVVSAQFTDVFDGVPCEKLTFAAVHNCFAARCLHQALANGEPFVGVAVPPEDQCRCASLEMKRYYE